MNDPQDNPNEIPTKPLVIGALSADVIKVMGNQYDPKYRTDAHRQTLSDPKNDTVFKKFVAENKHAAQYPSEGSKSVLGDAGIIAHKAYEKLGCAPGKGASSKSITKSSSKPRKKSPSRGL